jgi:hypothetical protein
MKITNKTAALSPMEERCLSRTALDTENDHSPSPTFSSRLPFNSD